MRALLVPLITAITLAGCHVPDTSGELWACTADTDCLEGRRCLGGYCRGTAVDGTCLSTTCAASGVVCGPLDDGCGTKLDCGPCARTLKATATIDDGSPFVRTREVMVSVTVESTDLPGGFAVRLANDDEPFAGDPLPTSAPRAWSLAEGEGERRVRAEVSDLHGNVVEATATVLLDTAAPEGEFTIAGGRALVRERTLDVAWTFADTGSGLAELCLENAGGTPACSAPDAAPATWTLPDDDGEAIVIARARDRAGNVSERSGRVVLDRVAPRLEVGVAGQPAFVTSDAVLLAIEASDENGIESLCPSNDSTYLPEHCRANAAQLDWSLGPDDGAYRISVRARDSAGNETVATTAVTLDRVPPELSASVASGFEVEGTRYVRAVPVQLSLGVLDVTSGAGVVELSTDGESWGQPIPFANTVAYFPEPGDGARGAWVRVTDRAGLAGEVRAVPFVVDTTPPVGSLTFASGAVTGTREVVLSLVAVDDGSGPWQVELSNDGLTWSAPRPVAAALDWTLAGDDGPKEVQARLRDRAGNEVVLRQSITLDSRPPDVAVVLNEGATHATRNPVRVAVSATDEQRLVELCLANDDAEIGDCRAWTGSPFDWTLPGEGAHTVRVRVKDAAGNTALAEDQIFLDLTPPTLTVTTDSGRLVAQKRYLRTTSLALALDASDGTGSGVTQVELSNDGTSWGAPLAFAPTLDLTLAGAEGERTQYVRVRDAAGLPSDARLVPLVLDTTPPSAAISINGGASAVAASAVTLAIQASDGAGSGLDTMQFSNESQAFSAPTAFAGSASWTLSTGTGTRTVRARVTDLAGNEVTASASILVDPTVPEVSCAIAAGGAATRFNAVPVTCTVTTAVALQLFTASDGTSTVPFTTLPGPGTSAAQTVNLTLTGADGPRTITVTATTTTGRIGTARGTIVLDTDPPVLSSIALAGGAPWTRTTATTLTVVAADPGGTASSGLASVCTGPSAASLTCAPYSATSNVTLAAGNGTKTVFAKVVDRAGLSSTAVLSDTIGLDGTAPTGASVVIAGGAAFVAGSSVAVTLAATDTPSGLATVAFSTDGGTSFGNELPWATSKTVALASGAGARRLVARITDNAGNATTAADDVTVDTQAPTGTIVLGGGAPWTASSTVAVTLDAADDGQLTSYCLTNAATVPAAGDACWKAYATSVASWALATGAGNRSVFGYFRDAAGNVSAAATDAIGVDATKPTVADFKLAAGASWTGTTQVAATATIDGTGSPIARYCVGPTSPPTSCTNGAPPATLSIGLPTGDGSKTVYLQVRDSAGNDSAIASDAITLDQTPPTLGSVTLAGGASYTGAGSVPVAVVASDAGSGLASYALSTDGSTFGAPVTWAAAFSATLAPGDGTRTLTVRATDAAGNATTAADTIIVDTVKPVGTLKINDGAELISTPTTASIGLTWTDAGQVTHVCLRNATGTAPAATDACWRAAATTISPWVLSTGDGTRSVFAYLRDAAGNVSAEFSDSVVVDTTIPVVAAVTINGGEAWTTSTTATVAVTADGTGSNLTQVCTGATNPPTTCVPYVASVAVTLAPGDGTKTIHVKVIDQLGRSSAVVSDTIGLDTAPPALSTVAIAGGAPYVNTTTVPITLAASDATSGVATVAFSTNGTTWGTPVPYAELVSTTLPAGAGEKTIHVRIADAAGLTATASDQVLLDTTAPVGTVAVNEGAVVTNAPATARVALTWTDDGPVTHVCLRTATGGVPTANDACWRTVAPTISPFPLASGDGARAVFARFRDAAGNVSAEVSDDLVVDTTPPAGAVIDANASRGEHRAVFVSWGAVSGADVAGYALGTSTDGTTYTWTPVPSGTSLTRRGRFPNGRPVSVRVKTLDVAGNEALGPVATVTPTYPWKWLGRQLPAVGMQGLALTGTTLVAAGSRGTVARSTDNGANWTLVDALFDRAINDIAFQSEGKGLFVGEGGTIGYTTDGGATWRTSVVDGGSNFQGTVWIARDLGPAGTDRWLAVGSSGAIYRADLARYDGTEPWTKVTASGAGAALTLRSAAVCTSCPAAGQTTIQVAADKAILQSTDLGLTFTTLQSCTSAETAVGSPLTRGVLWSVCDTIYSQTGGTRIARGALPTGVSVKTIVPTTDVTSRFYGKLDGVGWMSSVAWPNATSTVPDFTLGTLPSGTKPIADSVTISSGQALIADSGDFLSRGGSTPWARPPGVLLDGAQRLYALHKEGNTLWTTGSGGSAFRFDLAGVAAPVSSQALDVTALTLGRIGTSIYAAGSSGKVALSTNEGASFGSPFTLPGFGLNWTDSECFGTRCLLVGQREVMAMLENGALTTVNAPAPDNTFPSVSGLVSAGAPGATTVSVGTGGTLWVNTGSSRTVVASGTTNRLEEVALSGGVYVAVGSAGTILRATAPAGPWAPATLPAGYTRDLLAVSASGSVWLAAGAGTVLRSDDRGLTWREIASPSARDLEAIWSDGASTLMVGEAGAIVTMTRPWDVGFEPGRVVGAITGYATGTASGWACAVTDPVSLVVELHAGGAIGVGTPVATFTTEAASDATSEAACLTGAFPHRFAYVLSATEVAAARGKKLYAYARDPITSVPVRLDGANLFTVP